MARLDRLKEEIGWLKIVFTLSVALDASLVAWIARNYASTNTVLLGAGLVAAIVLAGIVVFVNRRAYRQIDQLEDL